MRLVRFHGLTSGKIRIAAQRYREEDLHFIEEAHGFLGCALGENHIKGSLATVTFWETEYAMRDTERFSRDARARAADTLEAPHPMLVDRFEVTLVSHLDRLAAEWGHPWMRLVRFQGLTPERIDMAAARYRIEDLAQIESALGFEGIALGKNHEFGSLATATFWSSERTMRETERDSQEAREHAAEAGHAGEPPLVDRFEVTLLTGVGPTLLAGV
jgi:heme-degrading monooxygenase HmoA